MCNNLVIGSFPCRNIKNEFLLTHSSDFPYKIRLIFFLSTSDGIVSKIFSTDSKTFESDIFLLVYNRLVNNANTEL